MSLQQLAGVLRQLSVRDAYKCYHLTLKGCQRVPCASFQTSAARDGKQKFIDMGIDLSKYSLRPLPLPKTGGRGPDGKIQTHGIGGGHKQRYRRVDFVRKGPKEGEPHIERITQIRYDPCRSADIAIAVSGNHKRYILATENMKVGDLIETYGNIPRIAVRPKEGNAYPLGALPISTLVHNIEKFAGEGGEYARAAGTCGELVRKVGDRCIVKLPSKREINVHQECMATVGRVSNIDHNKQKIGSAGRARWFGIRPQSGWWHRKTGYNGRKIRPVPPMITYTKRQAPSPEIPVKASNENPAGFSHHFAKF